MPRVICCRPRSSGKAKLRFGATDRHSVCRYPHATRGVDPRQCGLSFGSNSSLGEASRPARSPAREASVPVGRGRLGAAFSLRKLSFPWISWEWATLGGGMLPWSIRGPRARQDFGRGWLCCCGGWLTASLCPLLAGPARLGCSGPWGAAAFLDASSDGAVRMVSEGGYRRDRLDRTCLRAFRTPDPPGDSLVRLEPSPGLSRTGRLR